MANAKYGDSQIILTSWGALGGLGRASGRGSSRVATFPQLFLSNPARLTDRPESYTSLDLCRTLFIKSYPDSALFMIFNNSSFVINSFDAAIPDSAADSKTSLSSPSSMINFGRLRPPRPEVSWRLPMPSWISLDMRRDRLGCGCLSFFDPVSDLVRRGLEISCHHLLELRRHGSCACISTWQRRDASLSVSRKMGCPHERSCSATKKGD